MSRTAMLLAFALAATFALGSVMAEGQFFLAISVRLLHCWLSCLRLMLLWR
jgi:hypothetical protein